MKKHLKFWLLFAVLLPFVGCGDKWKDARFTKKIIGGYCITEYTVNDADSLSLILDVYAGTAYEESERFLFLGEEGQGEDWHAVKCFGDEGCSPGQWTTSGERSQLYLVLPKTLDLRSHDFPFRANWELFELEKDRIVLELWQDNIYHRMVLEDR